jgi:RNA polymerase sigma-70 factor (ECF subfamily)
MEPSLDPQAGDDARLVERVLDGDTQAFGELVRRYQRALHRHAVGMVLDHDVAADMVQDTFIRAFTHLSTCRDPTRFRGWIFQMLRNRCLDYLKEPRRRHIRLDDAGPLVDETEGVSDRFVRGELRAELRAALTALPPAQRECFLLHYVENMRYETMAELLGVSVSALKMRVLRARQALSAALGRHHVTESEQPRLWMSGAKRG